MSEERDTRFDECGACGHPELVHNPDPMWPRVRCDGYFGERCSCREFVEPDVAARALGEGR